MPPASLRLSLYGISPSLSTRRPAKTSPRQGSATFSVVPDSTRSVGPTHPFHEFVGRLWPIFPLHSSRISAASTAAIPLPVPISPPIRFVCPDRSTGRDWRQDITAPPSSFCPALSDRPIDRAVCLGFLRSDATSRPLRLHFHSRPSFFCPVAALGQPSSPLEKQQVTRTAGHRAFESLQLSHLTLLEETSTFFDNWRLPEIVPERWKPLSSDPSVYSEVTILKRLQDRIHESVTRCLKLLP